MPINSAFSRVAVPAIFGIVALLSASAADAKSFPYSTTVVPSLQITAGTVYSPLDFIGDFHTDGSFTTLSLAGLGTLAQVNIHYGGLVSAGAAGNTGSGASAGAELEYLLEVVGDPALGRVPVLYSARATTSAVAPVGQAHAFAHTLVSVKLADGSYDRPQPFLPGNADYLIPRAEACDGGSYCSPGVTTSSTAVDLPIWLIPNLVYTVQVSAGVWISVPIAPPGGQPYVSAYAEADPLFAIDPAFAQDYSLVYVGGVPEPAVWAEMIAGFGLLGGTVRRRRAVAALAKSQSVGRNLPIRLRRAAA